MADDSFSDPTINKRIQADVLHLQSACLEWSAEPTARNLDDQVVATLVETLDAHARHYFCKVDREGLIPRYINFLRGVGIALLRNAEERSLLQDPYSDDRLREMAESSGDFILRKDSLTCQEREVAICKAIERLREAFGESRVKWHQWKNGMSSRLEVRFEARYRHWEAAALNQVLRMMDQSKPNVGPLPHPPPTPTTCKIELPLRGDGPTTQSALDVTPLKVAPCEAQPAKLSNGARSDPDAIPEERAAMLQNYKAEGRKKGIRITDNMIAEAASPSWHERTPVQRWKRNDPRSTAADDAMIRRVLATKPHLKP